MSANTNIAIITYSRAYNYGSALQAYALNRFLNSNGFSAKTIDYTTDRQQELYRIFERWSSPLSLLRNVHSTLNYRKLQQHKHRFDEFLSNSVPMTAPVSTQEQLAEFNGQFDWFICGSDQIWNADCDDFNTNYILSFVNDKSRCIAYAPSLGAGAGKEKTVEAISTYASAFKAISSRENASSEIIKQATKRNVENVCDPVFLLSAEEWTEICPPKLFDRDYALGYFIGDVAGLRDFAMNIKRKTGMPVVVIYKNIRDLKYPFTNYYNAGPLEFISLVKHASVIITNSFHAVSFSLIFKKNFWAFINNAGKDTRISELLYKTKLANRIIDISTCNMVDSSMPIDYNRCSMDDLDSFISNSRNFLLNSLAE